MVQTQHGTMTDTTSLNGIGLDARSKVNKKKKKDVCANYPSKFPISGNGI